MEDLNEEINTIKNQTITKSVLFYKISVDDPSILSDNDRLRILKNKLNNEKIEYENKIYNSTKFIIKEISKDNNYFFGSICKTDSSIDIFTKLELINENEQINYDEIIFNHYTYFYIDYESLYISCIISKNIQSPDKYISHFLNFNNIGFFTILPLSKSLNDINDYINSFNLTFINNTDFESLKALENLDCEIKTYKVDVKLKNKGKNFIKNFNEIVNKNRKHLRTASVGNDDEEYDLIKNTFSKKAKINIPTNYEDKIDTIRLLLETELLKAKN